MPKLLKSQENNIKTVCLNSMSYGMPKPLFNVLFSH